MQQIKIPTTTSQDEKIDFDTPKLSKSKKTGEGGAVAGQ